MSDVFESEAKQAVTYVPQEITTKFGVIEVISIVQLVLPMLAKSFGSTNQASAQSYLSSHYDPEDDSFGENLERRAAIQARRAARRKGIPVSRDEAREIGKASLKHAMNAQESSVTASFALVDTLDLPDNEGF